MGNCFRGSPTDDFTRLRTDDNHDGRDRRQTNTREFDREPPPPYQQQQQQQPQHQHRRSRQSRSTQQQVTYHPTPGIQRTAQQLTEEEQIKIAQRIGLIQHLPTGLYYDDSAKKSRECAICMIEFEVGDQMRFLPCLHAYHKDCIDDWLMRSFTCPSCMEPVDAALLSSFEG